MNEYCKYCGAELLEGASACPVCGFYVKQPVGEVQDEPKPVNPARLALQKKDPMRYGCAGAILCLISLLHPFYALDYYAKGLVLSLGLLSLFCFSNNDNSKDNKQAYKLVLGVMIVIPLLLVFCGIHINILYRAITKESLFQSYVHVPTQKVWLYICIYGGCLIAVAAIARRIFLFRMIVMLLSGVVLLLCGIIEIKEPAVFEFINVGAVALLVGSVLIILSSLRFLKTHFNKSERH